MRNTLVITVLAVDRTGLVELLADRIAAAGGNWEASRMARLAGQFAGIMVVTCDAARSDAVAATVRELAGAGVQATVIHASPEPARAAAGQRVQLALTGGDRPGIVRDVSRVLAECSVNVEEFESEMSSAPMSGEPLFTARARLLVPASIALVELRAKLEWLAGELMVDLTVE